MGTGTGEERRLMPPLQKKDRAQRPETGSGW